MSSRRRIPDVHALGTGQPALPPAELVQIVASSRGQKRSDVILDVLVREMDGLTL